MTLALFKDAARPIQRKSRRNSIGTIDPINSRPQYRTFDEPGFAVASPKGCPDGKTGLATGLSKSHGPSPGSQDSTAYGVFQSVRDRDDGNEVISITGGVGGVS